MQTMEKESLFHDIDVQESTTVNGGGSCPTYKPVLVYNPRTRRYEWRYKLVLCWR